MQRLFKACCQAGKECVAYLTTEASVPSDLSDDSSESGLSTTAIVLISGGVIILIVLVGAGLYVAIGNSLYFF